MNINYDTIADAIYLSVGTSEISRTIELNELLNVDLDGVGYIVGIELLEASSQEKLVQSIHKDAATGVPISITSITPVTA